MERWSAFEKSTVSNLGLGSRKEPFIAQVTQTRFSCPLVALNATLFPPSPSPSILASLAYRHDFVGLQQNDLMYYEKYTEPIFDRFGRSVGPTQEDRTGCRVPHTDTMLQENWIYRYKYGNVKMKTLFSIFKITNSGHSF